MKTVNNELRLKKESKLSPERVRELFDYDAENGELIWKERPVEDFKTERASRIWNTKYTGKVAGCVNQNGYKYVRVGGFDYYVHRLVWVWNYGEWPQGQIDHITVSTDRTTNNRIENLRVTDQAENLKNQKMRKNNSSSVTGISFYKRSNKWKAYIGNPHLPGYHLGYFEDFFEAVCARKSAEAKYGYHENHGKIAA